MYYAGEYPNYMCQQTYCFPNCPAQCLQQNYVAPNYIEPIYQQNYAVASYNYNGPPQHYDYRPRINFQGYQPPATYPQYHNSVNYNGYAYPEPYYGPQQYQFTRPIVQHNNRQMNVQRYEQPSNNYQYKNLWQSLRFGNNSEVSAKQPPNEPIIRVLEEHTQQTCKLIEKYNDKMDKLTKLVKRTIIKRKDAKKSKFTYAKLKLYTNENPEILKIIEKYDS